MATTTNNTVETSVVDTLEQLLQRSVIDHEFRSELLNNPEAFGIQVDPENLVLPKSVAPQDMLFMELVNKAEDMAPSCRSTCVSGWTMRCDGTTL